MLDPGGPRAQTSVAVLLPELGDRFGKSAV